jgi:hypothetical protein
MPTEQSGNGECSGADIAGASAFYDLTATAAIIEKCVTPGAIPDGHSALQPCDLRNSRWDSRAEKSALEALKRRRKDNREKIVRQYKKRCWTYVQQRFLVRALCASVVSSFSTCKFGASELGETLTFGPLCYN